MKITKTELKRIIKEEKDKLILEASPMARRPSPSRVIADAEKLLAALMLQKVLADPEGPNGPYESSEIYREMYDIGYEDFEIQAALDQLADKYNLPL